MKTYYVQTSYERAKSGKQFRNNVGVLLVQEDGSMILKLYMYPDTQFRIVDSELGVGTSKIGDMKWSETITGGLN